MGCERRLRARIGCWTRKAQTTPISITRAFAAQCLKSQISGLRLHSSHAPHSPIHVRSVIHSSRFCPSLFFFFFAFAGAALCLRCDVRRRTNSLKADKYVEFLSKLYERITRRTQVTEWKKLKHVVTLATASADPDPSAAAASATPALSAEEQAAADKARAESALSAEQAEAARLAEERRLAALERQQSAIDRLLELRAQQRAATEAAAAAERAKTAEAAGGSATPTAIVIDPNSVPRATPSSGEAEAKALAAKVHTQSEKVKKLFAILGETEKGVQSAKADLDFEQQLEKYYAKVAEDKRKAEAQASSQAQAAKEQRKLNHELEMQQLTERMKRPVRPRRPGAMAAAAAAAGAGAGGGGRRASQDKKSDDFDFPEEDEPPLTSPITSPSHAAGAKSFKPPATDKPTRPHHQVLIDRSCCEAMRPVVVAHMHECDVVCVDRRALHLAVKWRHPPAPAKMTQST